MFKSIIFDRYPEQLIQKPIEVPLETTHQKTDRPQSQDSSKPVHIEQPLEKPPVICRVLPNRDKPSENFKM